MTSLTVLAAVYVFGGLTFLPLLLGLILLHAYWTLPSIDETDGDRARRSAADEILSTRDRSQTDLDNLPPELKPRTHVPDVAAGYFAVCREFVPGGINGKPPERVTPAGTVVVTESPSVYQSMYRSIFDRNKTSSPTLEGPAGKIKKARNVFYVVLRHRHLMLYDDSEQLEVRHVISLAHYQVDIYAGGNTIPEGELWIKRNCIRLVQRPLSGSFSVDSKPFFFFSENCSEKEDFYHAMLHCQERGSDIPGSPPLPLQFDTPDLVRLVQQLHASEESLHTRWINALIGRLFLSLYKTSEIEDFIRTKITKKIARVPKPALISGISLRKVDMGNLPPFITNPKLRELTVDGDLTIEADVSYRGNFRLEIAAIARIELGSRFKAREVTLVLAGILKRLEGHVLMRIKPPPSNRLWITFESVPKMELLLEPIVSSRQITYGVILRAIENRIREVINETLVFPNWDDMPFSNTVAHQFRGGIWAQSGQKEGGVQDDPSIDPDLNGEDKASDSEELEASNVLSSERAKSLPSLSDAKSKSRESVNTLPGSPNLQDSEGLSTATEQRQGPRPRVMRSGSFAKPANPIVNLSAASAAISQDDVRHAQQDAATSMKIISKSQPTTPTESLAGSPPRSSVPPELPPRKLSDNVSMDSVDHRDEESPIEFSKQTPVPKAPFPTSHTGLSLDSSSSLDDPGPRHHQSMSLPRNTFSTTEKRQSLNQSFNTATSAAKKWFASRQTQDTSPLNFTKSSRLQVSGRGTGIMDSAEGSHLTAAKSSTLPGEPSSARETETFHLGSPAHPIGRGQPLPPPGTPLPPPPKPEKRNTGWSVPSPASLANLTRRKPLPTKSSRSNIDQKDPLDSASNDQVSRSSTDKGDNATAGTSIKSSRRKSSSTSVQSNTAPPLPPRRQRLSAPDPAGEGILSVSEGLLVVEAPLADTSAPPSPLEELNQSEKFIEESWQANPWEEEDAKSTMASGESDEAEGIQVEDPHGNVS